MLSIPEIGGRTKTGTMNDVDDAPSKETSRVSHCRVFDVHNSTEFQLLNQSQPSQSSINQSDLEAIVSNGWMNNEYLKVSRFSQFHSPLHTASLLTSCDFFFMIHDVEQLVSWPGHCNVWILQCDWDRRRQLFIDPSIHGTLGSSSCCHKMVLTWSNSQNSEGQEEHWHETCVFHYNIFSNSSSTLKVTLGCIWDLCTDHWWLFYWHWHWHS